MPQTHGQPLLFAHINQRPYLWRLKDVVCASDDGLLDEGDGVLHQEVILGQISARVHGSNLRMGPMQQ